MFGVTCSKADQGRDPRLLAVTPSEHGTEDSGEVPFLRTVAGNLRFGERDNVLKQRNQKGSMQKRKQGERQMWLALWWEGDKRKFAPIGQVSKMTKATAEQEMAKLVQPINVRPNIPTVAEYVTGVFLPFKRRAWKESTPDTTEQRMRTHLIADLGDRMVSQLKPDSMAAWLDEKAKKLVSKSLVAHLRWTSSHTGPRRSG